MKNETYLNNTTAYCSQCGKTELARIVASDSGVYMERLCGQSGSRRIKIAADKEWYTQRMRLLPEMSAVGHPKAAAQGCPRDCGPCTWHSNGLRLPVFSITNDCNLDCPKCFTYNRPDQKYYKSPQDTRRIIRHIIAQSGAVQLINLTGGEPTLHPRLFDVLEACKHEGINRITMNTKGLKLAEDENFARKIKSSGVQLVLSVDTLDPELSKTIHGQDVTQAKRRALARLEELDIPTTLLHVCIKGVNEAETAEIVETYMHKEFIKSVTIQNMTYTGLNGSLFHPREHITMDEVEKLLAQRESFAEADFAPLGSYHPLCYSAAFYVLLEDKFFPLNRVLDNAVLHSLAKESYMPQPRGDFSEQFSAGLNRLWAQGEDDAVIASLKALLKKIYPPGSPSQSPGTHSRAIGKNAPSDQGRGFSDKYVKMILIHPHMDADNFDIDRVSRCGDLVPDESGNMVPACAYNLLYRQKDPRFWQAEGGVHE